VDPLPAGSNQQDRGRRRSPNGSQDAYFLDLVRDGVLEVRPDGSIWRHRERDGRGRYRPCPPRRIDLSQRDGYRRIYDGDHCATAHRIVWAALYGLVPPDLEVNHLDGVRSNNHPSNLEVVTPKVNSQYTYAVLKREPNRGERNGRAKLTAVQAAEIRQRLLNGTTQGVLAAEYGVCKKTIGWIALGVTWREGVAS
jgi:hypothetical protein